MNILETILQALENERDSTGTGYKVSNGGTPLTGRFCLLDKNDKPDERNVFVDFKVADGLKAQFNSPTMTSEFTYHTETIQNIGKDVVSFLKEGTLP